MHVVERLVHNSGVPYTIVRSNLFEEIFSDGFLTGSIREQNAVHLGGDVEIIFISVEDIASMVVAALQRSLTGKEIHLIGPEATSFRSRSHQRSIGPHDRVSLSKGKAKGAR